MKLKTILSTALLASVGLAMITTTANAAPSTISGNADDLILSFRATGGTGVTTNIEYDLGNIDTFLASASSFSLNLAPDLSANFGTAGNDSTWNTRTDLLWSVVATTYNAVTPNDTLTFTVVNGGTPDAPQSGSTQFATAGTLDNLETFLHRKTATTLNGSGFIINPASATTNSYFNLVTHNGDTTSSFGYFNTSVENNTNTTGGPVTAELYSDVGGASAPQDLGTFSLSDNGTLTFQAIPEPSTYALMGLGTLALMFWARRRKMAIA